MSPVVAAIPPQDETEVQRDGLGGYAHGLASGSIPFLEHTGLLKACAVAL